MQATGLARHWHPIATVEQVDEKPRRFTLLGEDLVAFRTDQGLRVFLDLCIHRGVALSLGFIEDGVLHCGYHGWAYDGTGRCVAIPSVPKGSPIPSKARAIVFTAVECYGLVWVALAEPVSGVPHFPDGEWDDPRFRTFVSQQYQWKTSAGRRWRTSWISRTFPTSMRASLGPGITPRSRGTMCPFGTVASNTSWKRPSRRPCTASRATSSVGSTS